MNVRIGATTVAAAALLIALGGCIRVVEKAADPAPAAPAPAAAPTTTTAEAAPATTSAADEGPGADAFLRHVYRRYESGRGDGALAHADDIFGGDMLRLIRRDQRQAHGDVGHVDGDPLCNCQDSSQVSYDIALISQTGGEAQAEVAYTNGGRTEKTTVDLQKTGDGWRITDLHRRDMASFNSWLRGQLHGGE